MIKVLVIQRNDILVPDGIDLSNPFFVSGGIRPSAPHCYATEVDTMAKEETWCHKINNGRDQNSQEVTDVIFFIDDQ